MGATPSGQSAVRSSERSVDDTSLSDYSLMYKYIDSKQVDINARSLTSPVEGYRTELDLALLRQHLKGPRVLDFPIGTGRLYPHFVDDYELYGFDISQPYVERAQAAYPQFADRFHVNSFEKMNSSMTFDSVYSMRALNRLKDLTVVVRSVATLLAPGGRWLFTLSPSHFHSADFAAAFESSGFRAVVLRKYDVYSIYGTMPKMVDYLYGSLFLRAVQRRLMPQWGYRLVDRMLSGYATYFVVAERC